jgi:thiosulfate/3-mercaptopyruvate sulfurtransferase
VSIYRRLERTVILVVAAALMSAFAHANEPAQQTPDAGQEMGTLVTAEWLSRHLDDPDLVVIDCTVTIEPDEAGGIRMVNGRASFESGHIPTAGFADLMGELSDADSTLEFALVSPEQFVEAMARLGVSDDSRVVLYDTNYSVWAARVWWMLRWVGFDRAALLDGGLNAWTAAGLPLSTESAAPPPGRLTLNLRPELIADRNEVLASLESDTVTLVDAMPGAHYRGEAAMYDRPGHIPGALNMPSTLLLDENRRFRPLDELEMLIDADQHARTITYCGGGISASADAFVLTRLGFTNVAVYAASLQEWAADPLNPMETDGESAGQK